MEKGETRLVSPDYEIHFKRYLKDFDLNIEDLRDKAILDIGSGMVPDFVEYCLKNGITNKIYAVDHWSFGHDFIYNPKDNSVSDEDEWDLHPFILIGY